MTHSLDQLRTIAEHAARAAGEILRRMQHNISAREKGPADLVTEADLAAQHAIRSILLYTLRITSLPRRQRAAAVPALATIASISFSSRRKSSESHSAPLRSRNF